MTDNGQHCYWFKGNKWHIQVRFIAPTPEDDSFDSDGSSNWKDATLILNSELRNQRRKAFEKGALAFAVWEPRTGLLDAITKAFEESEKKK